MQSQTGHRLYVPTSESRPKRKETGIKHVMQTPVMIFKWKSGIIENNKESRLCCKNTLLTRISTHIYSEITLPAFVRTWLSMTDLQYEQNRSCLSLTSGTFRKAFEKLRFRAGLAPLG